MSNTDVFAIENSAVNPFLFSEVGVELNGSSLTVLSVLARLGADPWSRASSWANLPRPALIDELTDCISRMPLCPQALRDARLTASRLIALLPAPTDLQPASGSRQTNGSSGSNAVRPMIFFGLMAIAMAFNILIMAIASVPAPTVASPATHSTADAAPARGHASAD